MGRGLATAWGKDNIQVNSVVPGWTDTDMTRGRRHSVAGFNERVIARTPLGRFGTIEDCAAVCCFLASPLASLLTGVTLVADGGQSFSGSAMLAELMMNP